MRKRRPGSDIFSLSFLDVICCGFGAMILLVLLSKSEVLGGVETVQDLLGKFFAAEEQKVRHEQARSSLDEQIRQLREEIAQLATNQESRTDLRQHTAAKKRLLTELQARQASAAKAAARAAQKSAAVDEEMVAGIPVDSNYIIFIVDTSGSMRNVWARVISEMENILNIHPQVSGFQIMNDNGFYLIKAYEKLWIPDTPWRRKSVLGAMRSWQNISNSSPVEGLEIALRTYAKRTKKLAIYIFGDDYSGGSYDPVLDTINKLNRDAAGQPIARIHGIGFPLSGANTGRFATLMREIARRNRGAFVALGVKRHSSILRLQRPN